MIYLDHIHILISFIKESILFEPLFVLSFICFGLWIYYNIPSKKNINNIIQSYHHFIDHHPVHPHPHHHPVHPCLLLESRPKKISPALDHASVTPPGENENLVIETETPGQETLSDSLKNAETIENNVAHDKTDEADKTDKTDKADNVDVSTSIIVSSSSPSSSSEASSSAPSFISNIVSFLGTFLSQSKKLSFSFLCLLGSYFMYKFINYLIYAIAFPDSNHYYLYQKDQFHQQQQQQQQHQQSFNQPSLLDQLKRHLMDDYFENPLPSSSSSPSTSFISSSSASSSASSTSTPTSAFTSGSPSISLRSDISNSNHYKILNLADFTFLTISSWFSFKLSSFWMLLGLSKWHLSPLIIGPWSALYQTFIRIILFTILQKWSRSYYYDQKSSNPHSITSPSSSSFSLPPSTSIYEYIILLPLIFLFIHLIIHFIPILEKYFLQSCSFFQIVYLLTVPIAFIISIIYDHTYNFTNDITLQLDQNIGWFFDRLFYRYFYKGCYLFDDRMSLSIIGQNDLSIGTVLAMDLTTNLVQSVIWRAVRSLLFNDLTMIKDFFVNSYFSLLSNHSSIVI